MTNYKKLRTGIASLVTFLLDREWDRADEIDLLFRRADKQILQIQLDAYEAAAAKLERYAEEAKLWSMNNMHDLHGDHISVSKREKQKAATELKRITKMIAQLREEIIKCS